MAIFNSKRLNRPILSSEIPSLDKKTIFELNEEIFETIESISQQIKDVKRFEKQHGTPPDAEWEARAKKKIRICSQFALKIENAGYHHQTYKDSYEFHLNQILAEELGPSFEKIKKEACSLATMEASSKQESD